MEFYIQEFPYPLISHLIFLNSLNVQKCIDFHWVENRKFHYFIPINSTTMIQTLFTFLDVSDYLNAKYNN